MTNLALLREVVPVRSPLSISDDDVGRALKAIRESGAADAVARWREEDRAAKDAHAGGRPVTFSDEALLSALFLAALHDRPPLAMEFTDILFNKVSAAGRILLGVPEPEAGTRAKDARYRNLRTRFHGVVETVDSYPGPRNRRLSPEEAQSMTDEVDGWIVELKEERLLELVNKIILAGFDRMNRELWRKWKGSTVVDATFVRAWAKPPKRNGPAIAITSTEPEAWYYVRNDDDEEHGTIHPPNKGKKQLREKPKYGFEASLILQVTDNPAAPKEFPPLVVAMAPLHRPGEGPAERAIDALRNMDARGAPKDLLCGDRLYSNSVPEKFQLPARALGYGLLFDYKKNQLGRQHSYAGAPMIEGHFYCPAIPEPMVNAELDRRDGRISVEISLDRHAAREQFRLRNKEQPDSTGHERLVCPAAGPNPTAKCPLKGRSMTSSTASTAVHPGKELRHNPPQICRQQSVVFPPEEGAKLRQTLPYRSDEWQDRYSVVRNTIEGINSHAKDEAFAGLGLAGRRRIRGRAAQTILAAFQILGSNLRLVRGFIEQLERLEEGRPPRVRPSRRKSASITKWDPRKTKAAGVNGRDPPPLISV